MSSSRIEEPIANSAVVCPAVFCLVEQMKRRLGKR
jgi:hypothetical protein